MSGGIQVFPFYVVCDTSRSMSGERIDSVNAGLPSILQEIQSDPVVAEKARFSVISFSTEARVELPLSHMATVKSMPVLKAGGQTNFAKAIRTTELAIQHDLDSLKAQGYSVLRPSVYFITDGRPGDGWKVVRDKWVDRLKNRYAPNVICFGVAEADQEILSRLSTRFVFMSDKGTSSSNALHEVLRSITTSVVSTTRSNEAGLAIPPSSDTLRIIDLEKNKD